MVYLLWKKKKIKHLGNKITTHLNHQNTHTRHHSPLPLQSRYIIYLVFLRSVLTRRVHRLDAAQDVRIYGMWMCGTEVLKPYICKMHLSGDEHAPLKVVKKETGKRRIGGVNTNTYDNCMVLYWWSLCMCCYAHYGLEKIFISGMNKEIK